MTAPQANIMGESADDNAKDEALADADIDVCDECGTEHPRQEVRECRKCGEKLCDFCMGLHECEGDYPARPPKKDVDKPRRM